MFVIISIIVMIIIIIIITIILIIIIIIIIMFSSTSSSSIIVFVLSHCNYYPRALSTRMPRSSTLLYSMLFEHLVLHCNHVLLYCIILCHITLYYFTLHYSIV